MSIKANAMFTREINKRTRALNSLSLSFTRHVFQIKASNVVNGIAFVSLFH